MQRRERSNGRRPTKASFCAWIALLCAAAASTTGAEPSSVVELQSFSDFVAPDVLGVSADGSTIFGSSRVDDEQGASIGVRPLRWNAAGVGSLLSVPASTVDLPRGAPRAASTDGATIVGFSDEFVENEDVGIAAMRWSVVGSGTTLGAFESNTQGERWAEARDVSADGSAVCGFAMRYDPVSHLQVGKDAVRWDSAGTGTPLASLGEFSGPRFADGRVISGDGTTIGGYSRKYVSGSSKGDRPVLWSAAGTATELPVLNMSSEGFASGEVAALSFDSSRAFGVVKKYAPNGDLLGTVAASWKGGAVQDIGPGDLFGAAPAGAAVRLLGCSASGSRAVGSIELASGVRGFVWTEGQGTVDLTTLHFVSGAYVGSAAPNAISADGTTVVGRSANGSVGEAFVWRNGQMRPLREMLQAGGVDIAAGGWQDFDDAIDCSSDGSIIVGIGRRNDKIVAFRAKINDAPTLTALTPVSIECTGEENLVVLSVTANDANSVDRLTVTWKVDGAVKDSSTNVVPGSTVTFAYDYPDGAHAALVEVSDGAASATSGTTITVVDTTAPTIVVAANRIVPTDPGKASAAGVVLSPPVVEDLCDGEPHLTNDAPAIFPLGPTIVKWTAEDDDGNRAVASQRVTVVDREKPRITGPRNMTVACDRGQTFATVKLAAAKATDNVPQGLKIASTAKARYPIGKSAVSWTATDAAGNQATWSSTVTVLNKPPVANAGKSVTVTATSERGARVTLDGSKSSDPDGHVLTYRWSAPGVRIAKPNVAKMTADFPVGSKTVKLTVTDEAGAAKSASVRVTVKLKNAKRRARGAAANAAFEEAVASSGRSPSVESLDSAAASARQYAAAAYRLGIGLGDHVHWTDGESPDDALLRYAVQRELQRRYGQVAVRRFLDSFVETGDETSLLSGMHALRGVAHAADDLTER